MLIGAQEGGSSWTCTSNPWPPKGQVDFKSLHIPRKREGLSSVSQEAFRMQDLKMRPCAFNVYFIFNYTLPWIWIPNVIYRLHDIVGHLKVSFSESIWFESILFIYWQSGSPHINPTLQLLFNKKSWWLISISIHALTNAQQVPRCNDAERGTWAQAPGIPHLCQDERPGCCFVCTEERCTNVLAHWHLIYQLLWAGALADSAGIWKTACHTEGLLPTAEIEKLGRYANSNWVWVVLITS